MSHSVDECYDVYNETVRRARQPHTCDACGETIEPGHQYTRAFWVFDGKRESVKRCNRCQTMHEHLRDLRDGDTWPAERLDCGRGYVEEWDTEPPPEIAALAFALPGETKPPPRVGYGNYDLGDE